AEVVGEKVLGAGFDGDLVLTHAVDDDVPHAREAHQVVANLADGALHDLLVSIAGEGEADRGEVGLELLDNDALGFFGQVLERIDLARDIRAVAINREVLFELDADRAEAFGDGGIDLLDAFDVVDAVFDLAGEGALDLVGRGAGVGGDDV